MSAQGADTVACSCPMDADTGRMGRNPRCPEHGGPRPWDRLVESVGQDGAVSVLLWLTDLYDEHALEVEGRLISPSVEWLIDSLRHAHTDGTDDV